MAQLQILKYPDPFLKTTASEVGIIDAEVLSLIDNMVETMRKGKGIGLAAVQVGVAKRVIVLDVPDERPDDESGEEAPPYVRGKNLVALINPEIIAAYGSTKFEEGCLSIPGITADVERAEEVTVRALDRNAETIEISTGGLFAIALQHEIDHLDGKLFIDRLSRLKREFIKRRIMRAIEAEDKAL